MLGQHMRCYRTVRAAYAQKPLLNVNAGVSRETRGPSFSLGVHLHPYFVYASSESAGETAHCEIIR